MELVSSHRCTKESLKQRIDRRVEQQTLQVAQIGQLEATLAEESARTQACVSALGAYQRASPRSMPAAVDALLSVYAGDVDELGEAARKKLDEAERYFAHAYRLQSKLDDLMGQSDARNPAGILMRPSGPLPPVALGPLTLPAEKDLSNLSVNFYRTDSWPIEPNARGGRASGELTLPAVSESDEDDSPWSDPGSEPSGPPDEVPPAPPMPDELPDEPVAPDAPAPMLPAMDDLPAMEGLATAEGPPAE